MQYLLSMYYPEPGDGEISAEDMEAAQVAMNDYAQALTSAGVLVAANVLVPAASATTVTERNGGSEILDGPFTDSPEQLGGVFILDVADENAAITWAERCPAAAWGSIEVRATAVYFADGAWRA